MAAETPLPDPGCSRKPLAGLAAGCLFGSIGAMVFTIPLLAIITTAWIFVIAALAGYKRKIAPFSTFLAAVSIAALNTQLAFKCPTPFDLSSQMERSREYVELIGVVTDKPMVTEDPQKKIWVRSFPLKLEGLRRAAGWWKVRDTVTVQWPSAQAAMKIEYGDRWLFHGLLSTDENRALLPARIQTYTFHANDGQAKFISGGHGHPVVAWCLNMRGKCRRILGLGLEAYPEQAGILRALLLGYREELPEALYRDFSSTGTVHLFAISGAHVMVMSVLLLALLRAIGVSRPHWILWLGPFLVLYTITTGMAPSAVRACIMAIVFWGAGLFGRRPDGLSSLALAALLILGYDPKQLVDLGFIFSFVTVAGLITLYPVMMAPFRETAERDPWALQPDAPVKRMFRNSLRYLVSLVMVSLTAWLASTPFTARFFNLFSPVALPANIFAVPAASLVMLTGCLALVTGSVFTLAGEIFNHANRVFITILLKIIGAAAAIPGGHFYVRSPGPWFIGAWYALLFLFLLARHTLRRIFLALVFLLAAAVLFPWPMDGATRIDLLDVGHGQAVLIDAPGDHDLLVDTGPAYKARRVIEHIRRQGINRLEALVLTHADADHIGAAAEILRHCRIGAIWYPGGRAKFTVKGELFEEAAQRGIPLVPRTQGDRGVLSSRVEWEILHPPAEGSTFRKADDGSIVLRITRDAGSILIMGGGNGTAESSILEARIEPAAAILIAGDQASSNTCSEAWIDAVNPSHVLVSAGPNLEGLPSVHTLERLERRHLPVLRTDMEGTIRIVFPKRMGTAEDLTVSAQNSDPR